MIARSPQIRQRRHRLAGLAAVLLALGSFEVLCADRNQEGMSPSGQLRYETSGTLPNTVTLVSTSAPEVPSGLGSFHSEHVRLVFSPDESWLLVKETGDALKGSLHLFKRGEGAKFVRVEEVDPGAKLEGALLASIAGADPTTWDGHCAVAIWNAESNALLLGVSGRCQRGDTEVHVTGWFAIYDLAKKEVVFDMKAYRFDLSLANRGAAAVETSR